MPEPLSNIVEAGWAEALEPVADQIARMGDFLREQVKSGKKYLPAGDLVLRAFKQPFADVKVLIVGQDPYPTPGHPVGLGYGSWPTSRGCRAAWSTSSASTPTTSVTPPPPPATSPPGPNAASSS